jgi:hypothetical protein
MAALESSERRLRSSGGRLRGCVLVSSFGLREDEAAAEGSVEWRAARDGREAFGSTKEEGLECFLGDLEGEGVCLTGDDGSE